MIYKNVKECDLKSHVEDTHGGQIASEMLKKLSHMMTISPEKYFYVPFH